MNIGIVGSGPARESVRAALDMDGERIEADAIDGVDFAVVVDSTEASTFERANEVACTSGTPWLAVELGGVGGHAVCEAAIAGFSPETACYACLCARVEANAEAETDEPDTDPATARLAGALAGYEARTLSAGEQSRVLGGVIEIPHAERRVLPVPNCACDGETDRTLAREYEERDLDASLARAERALDGRVGIVREVGEVASFPAPYYLARTGDTGGFSDASATQEAAGVATGWDRAFMKALGEALERYSAGVYRTEEFTHASADSFDEAVSPASFVLPDDIEPDSAEEIPWVSGEDLSSGDSVSLPAEFVQFPPPEHRHGPSITTGLGLGNSGVEALLSGLYEVIERDAAMLSWYSTFEPLGLVVENEEFAALSRRARSEGLSVTPVLLTQDIDVPVVAVAVEREEWPGFAVGSAADFDPLAAARSALEEALQSWMELRAMGSEEADSAAGAIGHYADSPDVVEAFFAVESRIPAESVGPDPVPSGEDELDALVGRVSDIGLDAYGARITPRDVEALGFEAVRVLVPEAQPLFTEEAYFGERARTVPRESGFEPQLDREFHPYP